MGGVGQMLNLPRRVYAAPPRDSGLLRQSAGASLPCSDHAPQRALRAFLVAQCAFERAQHTRHDLLVILAPISAMVWALAVWPGILPALPSSILLGGWWLLFAAALYAGLVEQLWLRRAKLARKDLSDGAVTDGGDTTVEGGR